MTGKVAELRNLLGRDTESTAITGMWDAWYTQRRDWLEEKKELRNFLFATDTTKTSVADTNWRNSTTLPKLAQLRDNLHANYESALFPNDEWLKWEGYTQDDVTLEKRKAIQGYMSNKIRESGFRATVSQLLLDYIDYGNAFADVQWVNESTTLEDGTSIPGYVGPKVVRVSPQDVLFNPTAPSFEKSPKLRRVVKTMGELKTEVEELNLDPAVVADLVELRGNLSSSSFRLEDFDKAAGYSIDGFGNLQEYYQSGLVEIIEFEGTLHNPDTGLLEEDMVIWIADRTRVVLKKKLDNWFGRSHKQHVGWRLRPDNLYAMGPLDNLVGMQYRIDHMENAKADALDQFILPPKVIRGLVEPFEWGPDCEIILDENGDVQLLRPELSAIVTTQNEIGGLMAMMEEFAGAPKQAMGIRTPGEKTAFEVQTLDNAAGRIFQNKITNFEVMLLEPILNSMLEVARREMDGADLIRVMDDDFGVQQFINITKEDITAKGKLRPIGARHFAQQAQLIQNLTQLSNTQIWEQITPHISNKNLALMVEDIMKLDRHDIVRPNIGVLEQAETQSVAMQAQEEVQVQAATPLPDEEL